MQRTSVSHRGESGVWPVGAGPLEPVRAWILKPGPWRRWRPGYAAPDPAGIAPPSAAELEYRQ